MYTHTYIYVCMYTHMYIYIHINIVAKGEESSTKKWVTTPGFNDTKP